MQGVEQGSTDPLPNTFSEVNLGDLEIIRHKELGKLSTFHGFHTFYRDQTILSGNSALITQSEDLSSSALSWSLQNNVGLSALVTLKSSSDAAWEIIIRTLGEDKKTARILIQMDSIEDPKPFLLAAGEVIEKKPIILMKPRTNECSNSYKGAIPNQEDIFDAAIKRVGVVRVDTFEELFTLKKSPLKSIVLSKPIFFQKKKSNIHGIPEVKKMIDCVMGQQRTLLDEYDSKRILSLYGIPVVETVIAHTVEEAVEHAKKIGFPVAIKLYSHTLTQKSNVGGVKLNLADEDALKKAYDDIDYSVTSRAGEHHFQGVTVQRMVSVKGDEWTIGSVFDQHLGPVIYFGIGGEKVNIDVDHSLGFPPLSLSQAYGIIENTQLYHRLKGQKRININNLAEVLVNFSKLIDENRLIKELDVNPILITAEGVLALDARIVLH